MTPTIGIHRRPAMSRTAGFRRFAMARNARRKPGDLAMPRTRSIIRCLWDGNRAAVIETTRWPVTHGQQRGDEAYDGDEAAELERRAEAGGDRGGERRPDRQLSPGHRQLACSRIRRARVARDIAGYPRRRRNCLTVQAPSRSSMRMRRPSPALPSRGAPERGRSSRPCPLGCSGRSSGEPCAGRTRRGRRSRTR